MTLNLYFLGFEIVVLFTFALCMRHVWRSGTGAVLQLFAGICFGLVLELATIRQLDAYHYGQFTLMVLDVPLAVGVAWGNMLYAVRLFSDATSLPKWARPVLDALLMLSIDLAMDALAIRLGMWDWGNGFVAQYFGVPWANFWAWFWVAFFFSAGVRLFAHRPGWIGTWLAPLSGFVLGLVGTLFTNALITFWLPRSWYEMTVAFVLVGALLLVLALRPRLVMLPHPLAGYVALISHSYFLIAGIISLVIFQPPFLLLVSLVMFAVSLYIYEGWRFKNNNVRVGEKNVAANL